MVFVLISAHTLVSRPVQADEVVISDDGRQIQLSGDGSWVQLSKDRYATNAAGQRVRLKADGTWTIIDDDELAAMLERPSVSPQRPLSPLTAASESTLFLARVEILKRRIKRAKSVHAETNTVYHLQVLNDSTEHIQLTAGLKNVLRARSSSGGEYPIESVAFDKASVAPGERSDIQVVAKGAPQWFGVKYMVLEVAAGALGNRQQRILSKSMDDVEKRSVDSL